MAWLLVGESQISKSKCSKPKVWWNRWIAYLRHIKTQWLLMGVISIQHHMIWTWLQCAHVHHTNINVHTINVCWVVFMIAHALIFHTKNQIGIIPNEYPSILFHIYHLIAWCIVHGRRPLDENKEMSFVFSMSIWCDTYKNIHQKRACCDGNIYCWFTHKFLYYSNTKYHISPSTCTHSSY